MRRWLRAKLGRPRSKDDLEQTPGTMEARDLTPTERALLFRILDGASFEGASELRSQIANTEVAGGIDTFFRLEVTRPAPVSSCEDGPIPVRAFVEGPEGEIEAEVLVWVKDGHLSGLEHAWMTHDAPTEMPSADRIRIDAS
jgi:hypothetical protein